MKGIAVGVGILLVCGVAGAILYTRVTVGQWSPFTPPDRLQFCGVRYYRTDPDGTPRVTRAQAMRADQPDRWLRATTVGLARWQVYRTSTWQCPESDDRNESDHTLFVKVGTDRYMAMDDAN